MTLHSAHQASLDAMTIEEVAKQLPLIGNCFAIDCVNWKAEFPYKPQVKAYIAHSSKSLFVCFDVTGEDLRAECSEDQGEVWCDSCVEMFLQNEGEAEYMNFETNCIGKMVATRRLSKTEGIRPFTPEQMSTIHHYASSGNETFTERPGIHTWQVCIAIPWNLISADGNMPTQLKGNFYKCADSTAHPHFLSWNPIKTLNPDFHRPEYFDSIIFDK